MTVRLYTDVHVPLAITAELRIRGVDVLTAQTDNATRLDDSPLLNRTTELGRVLFSEDKDLLKPVTCQYRPMCAGYINLNLSANLF